MNYRIILLVLIILILIRIINNDNIEKFTSNKYEVDKFSKIIMERKELFNPQKTYSNAKKIIKWLDPVIYYDLVKLYYKNNFNSTTIKNSLR